eukprot:TRINITY_DN12010_c0_g2_i3.p1 TRINITY_DN12010_c0_g2~~TRINITY_DN12010_c0_g2_i3.p1  ORF type:complete len:1507 (+),score=445.65 TRINITY_DN12010_c0_g2_i3:292-4521(+)
MDANGSNDGHIIEDVYLRYIKSGYALYACGKTGEAIPGARVDVDLQHVLSTKAVSVTLMTDDNGLIALGTLTDVWQLGARLHSEHGGLVRRGWSLQTEQQSHRGSMNGVVGNPVYVPMHKELDQVSHAEVTLFAKGAGGEMLADHTGNISIDNGYFKLTGLSRGNYRLRLVHPAQEVTIRIADPNQGRCMRALEPSNRPLRITQMELTDEHVRARVDGYDASTRVAVQGFFLATVQGVEDTIGVQTKVASISEHAEVNMQLDPVVLVSERKLADETRYVMDRRQHPSRLGNMLPRPSLLLEQEEIGATVTREEHLSQGSEGEARSLHREKTGYSQEAERNRVGRARNMRATLPVSTLDWCPRRAIAVVNLIPDAEGWVQVGLDQLNLPSGGRVFITAENAVDSSVRSLHVPAANPPDFADLCMRQPLPGDRTFLESRQRITLEAEQDLVLPHEAQFRVYDSLDKVFDLACTLSKDAATLRKFRFLTEWHSLSDADKSAKYSQYQCHEVNVFVYMKDPEFFANVVRPLLACRLDKDVIDCVLLGLDVSRFLEPMRFKKLNAFEKVLLIGSKQQRFTPASMATHLEDLSPGETDQAHLDHLFDTALLASPEAPPTSAHTDMFDGPSVEECMDDESDLSVAAASYGGGMQARSMAMPSAMSAAPMMATMSMAPPGAGGAKMRSRRAAPKKMMAMSRAMPEMMMMAESAVLDDDVEERASMQRRKLYQPPDETKEFGERRYWGVKPGESTTRLVTVNKFWVECARIMSQGSPSEALSGYWMLACEGSVNAALLALALLQVPLRNVVNRQHTQQGLVLRTRSSAIVYAKQIRSAQASTGEILVTHNIFDRANPTTRDARGRTTDRYLTGELKTMTVYGCRVVTTNVSSGSRDCQLLAQIPEGAVPLQRGFKTCSFARTINGYSTDVMEFYFYFPVAGTYKHFGTCASDLSGVVLGAAAANELKVVDELSTLDTDSWLEVARAGSNDQVLSYLQANTLPQDLNRIAWRMQDSDMFHKVIELLQKRGRYEANLWRYGFKHNHQGAMRDFISERIQQFGPCFACKLGQRSFGDCFQHTEFSPLINPRAHQVGGQQQMLNDTVRDKYKELIKVLCYVDKLPDEAVPIVVYHLLLQDRIEDALKLAKSMQARAGSTALRVQYDYMLAYMCFYQDEALAQAKELAAKYKTYPVKRWADLFNQVATSIAELDSTASVGAGDRDPKPAAPAMRVTLNETTVHIEAKDVDTNEVQVDFYVTDIELLFSTSPFMVAGKTTAVDNSCTMVAPNLTDKATLVDNAVDVALPRKLANRNLLIQVTLQGMTELVSYMPASIKCTYRETQGIVQVTSAEDKRLPRVYVKVYAKIKGQTKAQFHKDGYTDIRGCFDYVSVSSSLNKVEELAVLVISKGGASVKTCPVPSH